MHAGHETRAQLFAVLCRVGVASATLYQQAWNSSMVSKSLLVLITYAVGGSALHVPAMTSRRLSRCRAAVMESEMAYRRRMQRDGGSTPPPPSARRPPQTADTMGSSFDGTRQSVNRAQQARISAASAAAGVPMTAGWPRTARAASAAETEALTLTLTGCGSGVGVGLDGDNRVDMLKPGMPAAKALQMGDRVVSWNGIAMMDNGKQRLLKDVVTPGESHELVVERVRPSRPMSGGAAAFSELKSIGDAAATEAAVEEEGAATAGEPVANGLDPKLAAIFAGYAEPPDLEDL